MDPRPLIERLKEAYPEARCALDHQDPFQLLVATILSAQCTDARVNMVTPGLFARYPDARALAVVGQEDLEAIIRSTGFYRNKAKSIRGASERLVAAFGGVVPRTMEELLTLPGVARKTANVVLGTGYGIADGIVVDTHVERLARRLGLSKGKNPEEVERDLMRVVPREEWILFSHLLIFHGRRICDARKPRCAECPVAALCPSAAYFTAGKVPPWEKKGSATHAAAARAAAREKKAARAEKKRPAAAKKKAAKNKPAKKKTARKKAGKKAATRKKAAPARRRSR
ncbi:MAG: endonuclease III [Hyphomicrobiales bacterium]